MTKDARVYVAHNVESIDAVAGYIAGLDKDAFLLDELRKTATVPGANAPERLTVRGRVRGVHGKPVGLHPMPWLPELLSGGREPQRPAHPPRGTAMPTRTPASNPVESDPSMVSPSPSTSP